MNWWKRLTNWSAQSPQSGILDPDGNGCRHDEIHLRQGTAEFEWFIAKGELEAGKNPKHGVFHLANLLTYDPGRREWIELLDAYLVKAGSRFEKLLPRGETLYYGSEAIRAYYWHQSGRLDDAVSLLVRVTQAKMSSRYLKAWALDWLEPSGKIESMEADGGMIFFATVLNRFPEARQSTVRMMHECRRYVALSERYFEHHQPGAKEAVMIRVGLLRRAGRFDEALRIAQAAYNANPNWHDAVSVGLIWRQKGDPQVAETWFKKSLEHDPSDISARLEAGDTYFLREDWPNALRWYEEALERDSNQRWALPSAMFCRWKQTLEERTREQLLELTKSSPDNQRARALAYRAYMPDLPPPADASANVLRQISESLATRDRSKDDDGPYTMKMTITNLEAPSNMTAFRLETNRLGRRMKLTTIVNAIPKPDPRQPFSTVKYLLWKFEGTDPVPALPEPPPDVVEAITELASTPFDDPTNWADASRVAMKMGTQRVGELLAVIVHPPESPKSKPALEWLPRIQLAVCQVIAQIDDGWEDSIRREALYSVLLGPTDWSTISAIEVLGRIGREEEVYVPDIHLAFQKLADHRPDSGFCCWLQPLYSTWVRLPHLFPNEREDLEAILADLDRDEDSA